MESRLVPEDLNTDLAPEVRDEETRVEICRRRKQLKDLKATEGK